MSLYEAEEPLVPMASAPTPPRSWEAMLATWAELMATLAVIVGEKAPGLDTEGLGAVLDRLHFLTWAWMLSLPTCSIARKAAFEMGRAAMLIGRWRVSCAARATEERNRYERREDDPQAFGGRLDASLAIGQRAEEALRIVARQLSDVQAEARAAALGHPSEIAPNVRLYYSCWSIPEITEDFLRHGLLRRRQPDRSSSIRERLEALLVAVLPRREPGAPEWLMTSEDLLRLLADGTLP